MKQTTIEIEQTPNPNALKFRCGRVICEDGPWEFDSERSAKRSPLATRLFLLNGVMGVFVARDFVSVRKHEGVSWEPLKERVVESLGAWTASGEIAVGPDPDAEALDADPESVESRIREVLDRDVRPAVAMDGGDITLVGFDQGVVTVQLRGSCNGCPSSMATLKMGVERRLIAMVPEVRRVEAINE